MAKDNPPFCSDGWTRVSPRRPCPICKKFKGCLVDPNKTSVFCIRVVSDDHVPNAIGGYLHQLSALPQEPIPTLPGRARKAATPILDAVYRALLDQLELTEAHTDYLIGEGGLELETVRARGYRSWGSKRAQRSAMARSVYDRFGTAALDVPGLIMRKQKGNQYLTLSGVAGIAIPVCDSHQHIIGLQIRSEDGKYSWLSSASQGGSSLGAPVHVARPMAYPEGSGRVWLTEGPLKADAASDRLSEIVVAIPSINDFGALADILKELRSSGELRELLVALDNGWPVHRTVQDDRMLLAKRVARLSMSVRLTDCFLDQKGLGKLLATSLQPILNPYQVRDNSPRQLELTTKQAADFLGISRFCLIGILDSGELPFHKLNQHRRIRLDDILRYKSTLNSQSAESLTIA